MRFLSIAAATILLTACSAEGRRGGEVGTVDINAAAAEAQGDIDTYAADSLQPAAAPTPGPAPLPVASPAAREQAADTVVRRYFDLIAARRFDQARLLWDDDGRASGRSVRQFADGFAGYADYRADVGPPGVVEAGAGQRYVQVPVRVSGTLVDGRRPFATAGTVTLHRTQVDGATAAQQAWRISGSTVEPQPPEPAGLPEPAGTVAAGRRFP